MIRILRRTGHSIETAINQTSRAINIIGMIVLVAMMLLTVGDVFLRYVFNQPIVGSVELTTYFIVVVGFCGLAWCAVRGGHAKVDLLVIRFSPRVQAIFESVTCLLSLTVVPLLAWQGIEASNLARQVNTYSYFLEIPAYPFHLVLGISSAMLSLVLLTILVKSLAKVVRG